MLNFVVAWMAEARPLIDRYRLEPLSKKHGLRVYRNDEIGLIVCGQGRAAAAAGTAWLQALLRPAATARWINVGIAGHRDLAVGTPVVASSVTDRDSGNSWRLASQPVEVAAAEVMTVGAPDTSYASAAVTEMEASGFVEIATRFTERNMIGCLKIISDNAANPPDDFTPARATRLIEANLDAVEALAATLGSNHAR